MCGFTRSGWAGAALLALGGSAGAQDAPPSPLPPGVTACDFGALANDPSREGLNIRAAPNAHSAILGRLPIIDSIHKERIAPVVTVIGVKQGWFLIAAAIYDPVYELPDKRPPDFQGRGWVSGKLLTTGLRMSTLKAAPDENAADVVALQNAEGAALAFGASEVAVRAILDCKGEWYRIEAPLKTDAYRLTPAMPSDGPKDAVRGWTRGACTNQRTTCV